MVTINRMAGGPNYVEALRNALEEQTMNYGRPPSSGGTQISLRFRDDRLMLLEQLSEHSGWNRNQVVDTLLETGLFVLFSRLSNKTQNKIIDSSVEKLFSSRQR